MSRSSTVKGFGLTFDDLAAFTNHVLYGSPSTRNVPGVKESRRPSHGRTQSAFILPEPMTQERANRPRHSTSSSNSGSWSPPSPSRSSYAPSRSSSSYAPSRSSSSYTPSRSSSSCDPMSPTSQHFVGHNPRRLTRRELADIVNGIQPEEDIADMKGVYGDMCFEPLR